MQTVFRSPIIGAVSLEMIAKMLKKTLTSAMLALTALVSFNVQAEEEEKVLYVYNWSEYMEPSVIPQFEKETGIKVTYDVFDSNEVLEAKLLSGKSGYDLVGPGSDFLAHQIAAGVFRPLEKEKMPNLKYNDPEKMKALAKVDPGNKYAVPYMYGTTGIAYDKNKIKKYLGEDFVVDSWDVFFKPEILSKLKTCGVAVLNAPTEIIPTAMHYLGLDPLSTNIKDYEPAEKLLSEMAKNVTYFHSSQLVNDMATGDLCIVIAWSGDLIQAGRRAREANNGVDIEYIVPKEGGLIYYDTLAIPKDADHPQNAQLFINFLNRPEILSRISSYIAFASANMEAEKLVVDEVKNNPHIYLPPEMMPKMFMVKPLSPKLTRGITKMWDRIKVSGGRDSSKDEKDEE